MRTTMIEIIIGIVVIFLICIVYTSSISMNNAKSEVFSNITNTTTNKEIVEQIHLTCSKMPWWYTQTDCETNLLKTFVVPTK